MQFRVKSMSAIGFTGERCFFAGNKRADAATIERQLTGQREIGEQIFLRWPGRPAMNPELTRQPVFAR